MPDVVHEGIHHLTLNVQDVDRSQAWYRDVLDFEPVRAYATDEFARVVMRHPASGAVLAINRHTAAVADQPFDERRAGLDHLAFRVADRAALDRWLIRLDSLGVSRSEPQPGAAPGSLLVAFRDPDGTQLEMFVPGP